MNLGRNVVELIGHTPMVRLNRASDATGCEIWGKCEFLNPAQSIKDRAALYIVRDAEQKGLLQPGGLIVEGTAGNTGIGLADPFGAALFNWYTAGELKSEGSSVTEGIGQGRLHLIDIAHQGGAHRCLEHAGLGHGGTGQDGPALGQPAGQAAVQDINLVVTHDAEVPPHAGGRLDADVVVHHHPVAAPNAQGAHRLGEGLGRGQHVGQGVGVILDPFDVEQHGAGDVLLVELPVGRARVSRQIERRVEDAQVRRAHPLRQPCGGNDGVGAHAGSVHGGPGKTIVTVLCDYGQRYQGKLFNPQFLRERGLPTPPWME